MHLLVIPKKPIIGLSKADDSDEQVGLFVLIARWCFAGEQSAILGC